MEPPELVAIVLAGGASRRFGSDKLAATLRDGTVLEQTLAGLPARASVIILVGPARPLSHPGREVHVVREDPPGGGPAAALVAGLRHALTIAGAARIVVVPGDAPYAGGGADALLAALGPETPAAWAVDADGVVQPLQLALTPPAAAALVDAAGPGAAAGGSARALVARLAPVGVRLDQEHVADVDEPADLNTVRAYLRNADDA